MSTRQRAASLRTALLERRFVIVCGAGGVGKTTTAASLGIQAAWHGRRVLVCTIDPARRLATALGLRELSSEPKRLALDAPGELWAMMLDTRRTFDALVERYAPDDEARQRILGNRFYQNVSSALAGSQEYMAMENLLELSKDERFDLIVLDTPPTRHALDFLEAPDRLMSFLDASVLRFFLRPYFAAGRLTLKVAGRTGSFVLRLVDRVLGLQFLQDLSEFFLAFEALYPGFKARAAAVFELLRGPQAAFVVVASPRPSSLAEAGYVRARLRERSMPFASFVINRVHLDPEASTARLGPCGLAAALTERLLTVHAQQRALAKQDRFAVARFSKRERDPLVAVPELDSDVHDLPGLALLSEATFGVGALRTARSRARQRA